MTLMDIASGMCLCRLLYNSTIIHVNYLKNCKIFVHFVVRCRVFSCVSYISSHVSYDFVHFRISRATNIARHLCTTYVFRATIVPRIVRKRTTVRLGAAGNPQNGEIFKMCAYLCTLWHDGVTNRTFHAI